MNSQAQSGQPTGITGLPRMWAVAVQLVGTFGLAVFLVLYYVLIMQPRQAAKYEGLRESVDRLTRVVEEDHGLLTGAQAGKLEELFILAAAPRAADIIAEQLHRGTPAEDLEAKLQEALLLNTDLLGGLEREDGGVLSEMLTYKIINTKIAGRLAQQAVEQWTAAPRADVLRDCENALRNAIRMAARAK